MTLYADHLQSVCNRYARALEQTPFDSVLVYSGHLREQFLDDRHYPFAANPLFKHWLPLTSHPECLVEFRPGARPQLWYYQPRDYWYKPPSNPEGEWTEHFDLRIIDDLAKATPAGDERVAFLGEPGTRFSAWPQAALNPADLIAYLHFHRAAKSAYEIECMAEASRLGALGHRAAERAFRDGRSEYAIHLAYLEACSHTDDDLPYHSIVGLNQNAAVLHYEGRERKPPRDRHSFLIDAGASFNGYASDITRTYAAGDGLFADLLTAMETLQLDLCGALRPGLPYADLHAMAHEWIAGLLAEFNIVAMPADDIVASGLSARFFPHGLGHLIGLQVHDVGGHFADASGKTEPPPKAHPFLRTTRTLEQNYVVTIEPGVYFIDLLLEPLRDTAEGKALNWERIDTLRPCGGIRIEDDVVVTADGQRNLTREAFAALA